MYLCDMRDDGPEWRFHPDPIQGFAAEPSPVIEAVLGVEWPILESASLASAVRLAKRLWGQAVTVAVVTPHPSTEWLSDAFEEGASYLMLPATRNLVTEPSQAFGEIRLALRDLCPSLHQRVKRNVPLCVCGCHRDLMVLTSHHLNRWCVGKHHECPHWRAGDA